ncbi:MAG: hypothetical protein U9R25_18335 [Chloroflexota bacterium]|nr:hypothetical protein [Chloroflexota bacterium]
MFRSPAVTGRATFVLLILVLFLTACASNPVFVTKEMYPVPAETMQPELFIEAPEMSFATLAKPLPDGPVVVRGLYGEYGANTFKVCHTDAGQLKCRTYPLSLDASGPLLIEVSGIASDGQLTVEQWHPLDWDEDANRAAVQQELDRQSEALAGYDWSRVARSDFQQSSASLDADAAQFSDQPIHLFGYDINNDRIIWRIEGPEFPQERELVYRFPVVYFFTDPTGGQAPVTVLTIEGYVEE